MIVTVTMCVREENHLGTTWLTSIRVPCGFLDLCFVDFSIFVQSSSVFEGRLDPQMH